MMSLSFSHVLLLFYFSFVLKTACGIDAPPSVDCRGDGSRCKIFNSQGYWEDRHNCEAAYAALPRSEAELVHAVAVAVKRQQKIRVVSRMAHALPRLVCPGRQGLIINTQNYDSVIAIDKTAMTITVQAGIMMRDVMEEAAKHGLAVPAMIYWDGVSAAGVISTGAHGSGLVGKGSGVYEYVVSMRLVVPATPSEGYAKVITLTEADEDMKAARISLGTLGAISEITFALRPMFKRSVSIAVRDDKDLENEIEDFLRAYEFADIEWIPSHGKAVFLTKYGVPVDVPGEGEFAILRGSKVSDVERDAYQYDTYQSTNDVDAICNLLESQTISSVAQGNGFVNDGVRFTGYPVIGYNHRMQSFGGCQGNGTSNNLKYPKHLDKNDTICLWDRRVHTNMNFDLELRVPMSRILNVIEDIKKLRDLNPQKLCDIADILIRSVKQSEAYLGPPEDVVAMDLRSYRPREPDTPRWNEDVFEEIEQMVIEKHGGALHWGKSGGYLFGGLAKRAVNLEKFLIVKERLDPHGIFSNKWTNGLFGRGVEEFKDGCGLDKM
ncbi:hypothetical protein KI387_017781, partial [Taxus chinensis]